jgi:anti-anti-sigma factor
MSSTPSPLCGAGDSSPSAHVTAEDVYFVVCAWRPRPDVFLVAAAGEIDIQTIETLARVLDVDLPATTVLDLSDVTLLSAAGLRVLLAAAARADAERRRIRVVAHNPCVVRALQLTGLDLRAPVYRSLPAALRG